MFLRKGQIEFAEKEFEEKRVKLEWLKKMNFSVLLCTKEINPDEKSLFLRFGIASIGNIDRETAMNISLASQSPIRSSLEMYNVSSGKVNVKLCEMNCKKVLVLQSKSKVGVCSIVLRGSSASVLKEAKRSVKDAQKTCLLSLSSNSNFLAGGGSSEAFLCCQLEQFSKSYSDERQNITLAFSRALQSLLFTLSRNAGSNDPASLVSKLKYKHNKQEKYFFSPNSPALALTLRFRKGITLELRSTRKIFWEI